jgi:hypothetical protein
VGSCGWPASLKTIRHAAPHAGARFDLTQRMFTLLTFFSVADEGSLAFDASQIRRLLPPDNVDTN